MLKWAVDDANKFEGALEILEALSQRTRLSVVLQLAESGDVGITAGDLANLNRARQNTMSTHLGVLARAGVIVAYRGVKTVYRLEPARRAAVLAALHILMDAPERHEEPILNAVGMRR